MTANKLLASYDSGERYFVGADLSGADLGGANLRGADLGGADLGGADFPAPSMFLLASWGTVSNKLCQALMKFDAVNHDDSTKFTKWADDANCPYNGEYYQRCANFTERKDLFSLSAKTLSARQLMQCLLFEKTHYYLSPDECLTYVTAFDNGEVTSI